MNNKSKGLGDTVAKFTKAAGIDKVVKTTADLLGIEDCGCSRRQESWNNLLPYKQEITPQDDINFEEGKYNVLSSFIINNKPESLCYQKDDKLYISKENELYEKYKIFYKLGILVKDES